MSQNWDELVASAIETRRQLHQQPELTWAEHATAQLIRQRLDELGIAWQACADTGTLGRLAADKSGRHIALRGDIDALPINEESGVAWQSQNAGCMHACGHDGHTAALLGTAAWLKQHEAQLPGPVTLVFQPAEEGGHGAKHMIEDGALEGIDEIFGWHNWPAIPLGQAVCPDGAVMSANGTFVIDIKGQGGHASQPELCRDPVLAAAAITVALQQVVSRRLPPQQATVLSVTHINAPSGDTVIPSTARLGGSIRLSDSALRGPLEQAISEVATATAQAHGVTAQVEHIRRYDATVNHAASAQCFRNALQDEFGKQWQHHGTSLPIMASEDFSYYLQEIPGAFALIGGHDGTGTAWPCHSPHYDFNDALIGHVMRVYSRLVGLTLA